MNDLELVEESVAIRKPLTDLDQAILRVCTELREAREEISLLKIAISGLRERRTADEIKNIENKRIFGVGLEKEAGE